MNAIIENIRDRRSVRSFEDRPVPKDILESIINAGNLAPSGGNTQMWRFVVAESESFRKKLAGIADPVYRSWIKSAPKPLQDMRKEIDAVCEDPVYYSAPAVVFVVGSGNTVDYDCSMACENIMLAARAYGVGSCWVFFGQFALGDPEVKSALELAEGEKVYGPILLGYPKGGFPEAPKKKPAKVLWL